MNEPSSAGRFSSGSSEEPEIDTIALVDHKRVSRKSVSSNFRPERKHALGNDAIIIEEPTTESNLEISQARMG